MSTTLSDKGVIPMKQARKKASRGCPVLIVLLIGGVSLPREAFSAKVDSCASELGKLKKIIATQQEADLADKSQDKELVKKTRELEKKVGLYGQKIKEYEALLREKENKISNLQDSNKNLSENLQQKSKDLHIKTAALEGLVKKLNATQTALELSKKQADALNKRLLER